MSTDKEDGSSLRHGYRALASLLRAIHSPPYLSAKAEDFKVFTRCALILMAIFFVSTVCWDYAIDPVNAWRTVWLRLMQCAALLAWAFASWNNLHSAQSRAAAVIASSVVVGAFTAVLSRLDGGDSYGVGGFLYIFIFGPFVLMAQPFVFTASLLAMATAFPMLAAPFGLSADLHWGIYNAYVWMGYLPIVCILLLFEYLYWQLFCYRCQVETQAVTDGLTRIANRRHFLTEATRSLELHNRQQRPVSLLFVDIDHFKAINDRHGHAVGDAAIRHVVDTLAPLMRASDLMARYGGEEFVVLLPETSPDLALRTAERMRSAVIDTPFVIAAGHLPVIRMTVSIGVATRTPVTAGRPDIDVLLREADVALYEAKQGGRNRVVGHGPSAQPIVTLISQPQVANEGAGFSERMWPR